MITLDSPILVRVVVGCVIGLLLLSYSLSLAPSGQISEIASSLKPHYLFISLGLYISDLALRGLRWNIILLETTSYSNTNLRFSYTLRALFVGYAFNNLLPARLGELFRADFLKRQTGIGRTDGLASIMIERSCDLILLTAMLSVGMMILSSDEGLPFAGEIGVLLMILKVAFIILLLMTVGLLFGEKIQKKLPAKYWISRKLVQFIGAVSLFKRQDWFRALALSAPIWALETLALYMICQSIDLQLSSEQLLVLVGAVSLCTLVPTAPGYLGSYQFVFSICAISFGSSAAAGILAATLVQLFLLLPVTIGGCITVLLIRHTKGSTPS